MIQVFIPLNALGFIYREIRRTLTDVEAMFNLLRIEPQIRYDRLVEGFGGAEEVRAQVEVAVEQEDFRWALELSTWLARRSGSEPEDQQLCADALRAIAYRTSSTNVRNWCLTRALERDGSIDLGRFRTHRFRETCADQVHFVLIGDPEAKVTRHDPSLKQRGCVAGRTSDGLDVQLLFDSHQSCSIRVDDTDVLLFGAEEFGD